MVSIVSEKQHFAPNFFTHAYIETLGQIAKMTHLTHQIARLQPPGKRVVGNGSANFWRVLPRSLDGGGSIGPCIFLD